MRSRRPRRSNAASSAAPPAGPCLLHRLPPELLKNIVELSIEEEDLAPYPHQQRTFELAGQVCRLWHDLLSHPQAYVVTDVLMAKRLAKKLKRDGTGRAVRKLGIDYSGRVEVNGRTLRVAAPIAELLDEVPRLLELILVGTYSEIANMMRTHLRNFTLLQRLELDFNEDDPKSQWAFEIESWRVLPHDFLSNLKECPNLIHLDMGRLECVATAPAAVDDIPDATMLGLVNFSTPISPNNLPFISRTILAISSTLTILRLGAFKVGLGGVAIADVLVAIAPVVPTLVEFEWKPRIRWNKNSQGEYEGISTLASMTQLRHLETGSILHRAMLGPDSLLAVPSVESLILNTNYHFWTEWNHSNKPADAVVAFLSSPASRGLKYFHIRTPPLNEEITLRANKAQNDVMRRMEGTGIEVVFD
ncbi:hypothetical protein RQP46_005232 [Phenoliferia psychrophenolica]